jgi:pyruvate kinase
VRNYAQPEDVERNIADAIGRASCVLAEQIHAAAIVTLTTSGGTAEVIAKYRPHMPILALTDNDATLRRLSFVWGVHPVRIPGLAELQYDMLALDAFVLRSGLARTGELVVYSAGTPLQKRPTTNMLEVRKL